MPKGQKGRDDTVHQLSGFDLSALPTRQSHRGIETHAKPRRRERRL